MRSPLMQMGVGTFFVPSNGLLNSEVDQCDESGSWLDIHRLSLAVTRQPHSSRQRWHSGVALAATAAVAVLCPDLAAAASNGNEPRW